MSPTPKVEPNKKKMYGLLHDSNGEAMTRQVRVVKVGIGVPSGPDVHVWIDVKGQWAVERGVYDGAGKRSSEVKRFDTKSDAHKHYLEVKKTSAQRKYPRRVPYFTFLRMDIDGNFSHDFDAIEIHGPVPSEIDVVFITDDPFEYAYQYWTAAELKCYGDGLNARRRLDLAKTPEEKTLAEESKATGDKFFPIVGGCYTCGCPYPKGDKPLCKPHGRLFFQLVNSPRIGGTCTYDTTGFRSIQQIFSCTEQIKSLTGRGDPSKGCIAGVPLKMILRPYKVSHNGKPSVQYGVSLEFRAKNAVELGRLLVQHTQDFRQATQVTDGPKQLEAPTEPGPTELPTSQEEYDDAEAPALDAEFYGEFEEVVEDEAEPEPAMPRRASEAKQEPLVPTPEPEPTHNRPVEATITHSPSVTVSAPPAHMVELKRLLKIIGEARLLGIMGQHGISDMGDLTPEAFEKMKPDFDLAERARLSANGEQPQTVVADKPTFGQPPPKRK